jgi:four helix bundle protein
MRRTGEIVLLIPEGAGLATRALFRHRLALALGELSEVVGGTYLALDRGYIGRATHRALYASADSLAKQLNALRRRLDDQREAP